MAGWVVSAFLVNRFKIWLDVSSNAESLRCLKLRISAESCESNTWGIFFTYVFHLALDLVIVVFVIVWVLVWSSFSLEIVCHCFCLVEFGGKPYFVC